MATLAELSAIKSDPDWGNLQNKVRVAATIKAAAIIDSATPTAEQIAWAKGALKNPVTAGDDVIYYVIASNASFTVAQILGAADTAIQSNVNDAVDKLTGA